MIRHLVVHAGLHRGIWVRDADHVAAVWEAMRFWHRDLRAIAATLPVRVAADDAGWRYLKRLVSNELEIARKLKGLGAEIEKIIDPDRLPDFGDEVDGYVPSAPFGEIDHYRTESDETGVSHFTVDGRPAGGGLR